MKILRRKKGSKFKKMSSFTINQDQFLISINTNENKDHPRNEIKRNFSLNEKEMWKLKVLTKALIAKTDHKSR